MGEVSRQNRGCEFNQTWASQERLSVQILPREAPSNWHEPRGHRCPHLPSRAKLDRSGAAAKTSELRSTRQMRTSALRGWWRPSLAIKKRLQPGNLSFQFLFEFAIRRPLPDKTDLHGDLVSGNPCVCPPDYPIAPEKRHRIVAAHTLGGCRISFKPIRPSPKMLKWQAIPYHRIKGSQEAHQAWRRFGNSCRGRPQIDDLVDDLPFQFAVADQALNRLSVIWCFCYRSSDKTRNRVQSFLRHRCQDVRDRKHQPLQPLIRRKRCADRRHRLIYPYSFFTMSNSKKSAVMQPFQRTLGGLRVTAPSIDDPLASKGCLRMAGVHGSDGADQLQNLLVQFRQARRCPRMEQLPDLARKESVRVQVILLDIQRSVVAFEISRLVDGHSMAKDQVLCPRGRTDGIRLDKTHALDGRFQRDGGKERMRDGVKAQLLKVCHKDEATKSTRVIKVGDGPVSSRATARGS